MAASGPATGFPIVNGKIQGCRSKNRWSPGDPLPWTASICQGVPFVPAIDWQRCMQIPDFQTRPDDVFVVTYPKSGTTWMLQIIKCLQTQGHPEALEKTLDVLYPWFEDSPQANAESMPSPRILKSHSPYHMAAKGKTPDTKCKYIHVMRNPKDTCVSQFHHMKGFKEYEYNGDFSEFIDLFLHGQAEAGSWFEFVRAWLECEESVLQVKYEDIKKDPASVIRRVADFMEIECTDEIVKLTIEKSSFSKMKKDKYANMTWMDEHRQESAVGTFMRKGEIGNWKNYFTAEQSERFDAVMQERTLPNIEFDYGC